MNELSTPLECREVASSPESSAVVIETERRDYSSRKKKNRAQPKRVTEAEYWEKYYFNPNIIYEWNDGILEEKAVSDKATNSMYGWLFELTGYYLKTHQIGERLYLETGFRLVLPHKTVIRRPDFGVILNDNPVPYQNKDHSYKGVCNFCVEAISDLTKEDIERDTKTKLSEYEAVGVQEYYILDAKDLYQEFYALNQQGVYVPLQRVGSVIKSSVLPGFQFRISDLHEQPIVEEMIEDPVYQGFVLPGYRDAKIQAIEAQKRAEAEGKRAEAEARRADVAEAQAREEKKARLEERKARQAAESQAVSEKKARQAAEDQAVSERKARLFEEKARQAAEARNKLLEAELARLQKR
jgi:Uma2 family endonuclease